MLCCRPSSSHVYLFASRWAHRWGLATTLTLCATWWRHELFYWSLAPLRSCPSARELSRRTEAISGYNCWIRASVSFVLGCTVRNTCSDGSGTLACSISTLRKHPTLSPRSPTTPDPNLARRRPARAMYPAGLDVSTHTTHNPLSDIRQQSTVAWRFALRRRTPTVRSWQMRLSKVHQKSRFDHRWKARH